MILYESSASFLRGFYPPFGVCLPASSASHNMSSLILLKPGTSSQREMRIGTHVDAPLHFIENGKSIDQMPINQLIGQTQIIEVPFPEAVSSEFLITSLLNKVKIVIFKFGRERLDRKHPYFLPDGVNYLVKKGIKTVGTDNYNIDSETTQWEIHHLMLGQEMMIIEGLKLDEVSPGFYELICLPILIRGGEAAPARAILIR